jgi:hypothetical protein
MDHHGDMTGFLESGIDGLVSLHHMFSWWRPFTDGNSDQINETMHRFELAYGIFDIEFFKRYVRFNYKMNQTLLLTMGYSFSLFNRILSFRELSQIEKTWCCTEMVGRKTRSKETNKTTWYFRGFTSENSGETIGNGMVYESKKDMCGKIPNIEITLRN